jgi:hypothetical protein
MVEWFQERYISRDEHRKIVEYYRKLVAQLHVSLQDLRGAKADVPKVAPQAERHAAVADPEPVEPTMDIPPKDQPQAASSAPNIIHYDFRRQRR